MKIENEFVDYNTALALKELGFDEPCFAIYNLGLSEFETANIGQIRLFSSIFRIDDKQSNISYINDKNTSKVTAPLYQQAFRWFREKYELFGCIDLHVCTPSHWYIRIDKIKINDYLYHSEDENIRYNTYEEAEFECLKKLIEIINESKKD